MRFDFGGARAGLTALAVLLVAGVIFAVVPAVAQATAGYHHETHDHGHAKHEAGGHGSHSDDATATHRFDDIERWENRFENAERDAWQMPDRVVEILIDRPDLTVADVGSATGYFPVRFARALPEGMVFGSDIEPGMVRYLNDRARSEELPNLVSVLAGPESPHVPRAVDILFLCNTYHHIDGRIAYFERVKAMLRPGGRVAIVDFRLESERGPAHKLAPDIVEKEMAQAGYRVGARHDFLPDQYFLVFEVEE